jgi:protein-S-isoprenylcysteine O-methyltransferase Ste14
MEIRSPLVERFLKSFALSVLLCLVCAWFTFENARALAERFDLTEAMWLLYNAIVAGLFLIRSTPSAVDTNPWHWAVALVTSFSGFAFSAKGAALSLAADGLIWSAIALSAFVAVTLGRSYDFLPALRNVRTTSIYRIVRHPMYTGSMAIKLGYVLKHPSLFNALALVLVAFLYDRRASYEETVMSHDASYVDYLQRVKHRFIPGVY